MLERKKLKSLSYIITERLIFLDIKELTFLIISFIQVWRRDNWVCVKTLSLHKDSIWDLRLHNDKVVCFLVFYP